MAWNRLHKNTKTFLILMGFESVTKQTLVRAFNCGGKKGREQRFKEIK